jgi:hypothetical protein
MLFQPWLQIFQFESSSLLSCRPSLIAELKTNGHFLTFIILRCCSGNFGVRRPFSWWWLRNCSVLLIIASLFSLLPEQQRNYCTSFARCRNRHAYLSESFLADQTPVRKIVARTTFTCLPSRNVISGFRSSDQSLNYILFTSGDFQSHNQGSSPVLHLYL